MICCFNRPNFGPERGGGDVYHVVVGVSHLAQIRGVFSRGSVWYERDGTCDNNKEHRIVFNLSY